jgi:hypothetical protein
MPRRGRERIRNRLAHAGWRGRESASAGRRRHRGLGVSARNGAGLLLRAMRSRALREALGLRGVRAGRRCCVRWSTPCVNRSAAHAAGVRSADIRRFVERGSRMGHVCGHASSGPMVARVAEARVGGEAGLVGLRGKVGCSGGAMRTSRSRDASACAVAASRTGSGTGAGANGRARKTLVAACCGGGGAAGHAHDGGAGRRGRGGGCELFEAFFADCGGVADLGVR